MAEVTACNGWDQAPPAKMRHSRSSPGPFYPQDAPMYPSAEIEQSTSTTSPRSGGGGGPFGSSHHHHHHRRNPQNARQPARNSMAADDHHYQTHILMGQWRASGYDVDPEEDMARYYSSYKKGSSTVIKWGPPVGGGDKVKQDSQKGRVVSTGVTRGDEREVGGGGGGTLMSGVVAAATNAAKIGKQVSFSADRRDPLSPLDALGGNVMRTKTPVNTTMTPLVAAAQGQSPPPPSQKESPAKKDAVVARMDVDKGMANLNKDCFIIPVASLDRFLPAGVMLPKDRRPSYLNVLEIDDPKLCVFLHVMTPLAAAQPVMESPLTKPFFVQMSVAKQIVEEIHAEKKATEGMLLVNMERNAEYPFINYFVINKGQTDPAAFFEKTKLMAMQKFDPSALRYRGDHMLDLYNEVATIARPPVEPTSKKPLSKTTGYIISVFRVFEGDDSEKLERNWLYWTGARMLYRYLPRCVGLRRITLHKSVARGDKLYLLLCECTNFLDNIAAAAWLVPALRARLCGYTGIYRAVTAF